MLSFEPKHIVVAL